MLDSRLSLLHAQIAFWTVLIPKLRKEFDRSEREVVKVPKFVGVKKVSNLYLLVLKLQNFFADIYKVTSSSSGQEEKERALSKMFIHERQRRKVSEVLKLNQNRFQGGKVAV